MSLPQPDPSLPGGAAPVFGDTDAARGDHLRAAMQAIWINFEYLNDGENINDASAATPVDADKVGFFQIAGGIIKYVTWAEVKSLVVAAAQTAFANLSVKPGTCIQFAGSAAPTGYLACDGSAVSRTTYADLFGVISTTYGVGNGSTTFNLPDIRGLFVRGAGAHGTMTKAAGGAFDGGSVGATSNDQMQGHYHIAYQPSGFGGDGLAGGAASPAIGAELTSAQMGAPKTDGTNGTPRTGNETKPASMSLLYCIKT